MNKSTIRKQAWREQLKQDPIAYEAYLVKQREIAKRCYDKRKEDPKRFQEFLNKVMDYKEAQKGSARYRYWKMLEVAADQKVKVTITFEEFESRYLLAVSFYSGKSMVPYFNAHPAAYGLDRIKEGGDYSWDNVVWSELPLNYLRTAMGWNPEQLKVFCEAGFKALEKRTTITSKITTFLSSLTIRLPFIKKGRKV